MKDLKQRIRGSLKKKMQKSMSLRLQKNEKGEVDLQSSESSDSSRMLDSDSAKELSELFSSTGFNDTMTSLMRQTKSLQMNATLRD